MPQRPLTVEIFKDLQTPEVSIDEVLEGVGKTALLAEGLDIVRTGRKLRISKPGAEVVLADKINSWPDFTADINIVTTARPIEISRKVNRTREMSSGTAVLGAAGVTGSLRNTMRVAIVRAGFRLQAAATAGHEIGHLLDVRPHQPARADDADHCADTNCLMAPSVEAASMEATTNHRIAGFFLNDRAVQAQSPEYCDGCAESLGRNAYFLTKAKNGEFVPDALLPHYGQLL